MPDQSAGTLSYGRQKLSTTAPTSLIAEYRTSAPADNQVKIEQYVSLDPDAVAQANTITITAGTTGDLYIVTIGGTAPPTSGVSDTVLVDQSLIYQQKAGDTAIAIASALAKQIDNDPRVSAKASANKITVQGVVPGLAFTVNNTGSTTAANVAIAETTKVSGTPKHTKLGEARLDYGVDATGKPTLKLSVQWFTGDVTSVAFQSPIAYPLTGPKSLDDIQLANNVPRPV